jgi:Putative beta-barrel porin-2, OmpL-like. bbp2
MARSSAKSNFATAACLCLNSICLAQNVPVDEKPPDGAASLYTAALPSPPMTGPLQGVPPLTFDVGPLGKVAVNGLLSGVGLWQGNHVVGNSPTHMDLSNGQVYLEKPEGWFQFYLQAGAYTLPDLATPFLAADKTMKNFFGPIPLAYVKLAPSENTSIQIGVLPTLIGAEYTFSFENMNIERGLLWNQENAVNRGIQLNQKFGKFTASLSWNDGFYSNRYTWLTGSLTYTNGHHSLTFVGGGNLGQTAFQSMATPIQNNSSIYNVIYTYTNGPWIVQPYFQYTDVPTNQKIGIAKGASTQGGALLLGRAFGKGFSLAGRWEYINSNGDMAQQAANLMFGPGSAGTSVTLTPTMQRGGFFVRGDLSYVHALNYTPGFAFGPTGMNQVQHRLMAEIGFMFGDNLVRKRP